MQNRIRADRLHAPEIVAAALKADSGKPILCEPTFGLVGSLPRV
jgi:hypothetical protein